MTKDICSLKRTLTPENATDDFITIMNHFYADFSLDYRTIEDPDSLTNFNPPNFPFDNKTLREWIQHSPFREEELFLRSKDYKDRDLQMQAP